MPSRGSRSWKSRTPPSAQPARARPRLTEEQLQALAKKMQETYKWDSEPKDFQLEAVQAQIEGVDMIVQAPTGSGKTALAAGPHLWPGNEKKFTLMICPLLSLEEEMVQTFDLDFGLKAITLNSKNGACSPLVVQDILALKYQIILVSPEMAQSRTFMDRILRNTAFMRNNIAMFIDEAHCIVHWGADFRKHYGTLGTLRVFLPPGTPIIAVTATLTARVRRSIHKSLLFAHSPTPSRFINKGNDRPNISIVVRACEHPLNSFADLDFLIPTTLHSPSDILKTYLYVDNISVGGEIIDYLNAKLENHPSPAVASGGFIRPFNATLSQEYRNLAMAHFRAGNIRIMVCTDAAGMGCNISDIDRVVQWKLPATFSNWIQRADRAARGRGRTGLAVLLVEKSAYNTDLVSQAAASTTGGAGARKTKKKSAGTQSTSAKVDAKQTREYARAHGSTRGGTQKNDAPPDGVQPLLNPEAADEGLLTFVQSVTCRRKVWAEAFESPINNPLKGLPDLRAQAALQQWRDMVYLRDHPCVQYDETAVLSDDLIGVLVTAGPLPVTQVRTFLQDKWVFYTRHGEELVNHVTSLAVVYTQPPAKPRARKVPPAVAAVSESAAQSSTKRHHPDALVTASKRPRVDAILSGAHDQGPHDLSPTPLRLPPHAYPIPSSLQHAAYAPSRTPATSYPTSSHASTPAQPHGLAPPLAPAFNNNSTSSGLPRHALPMLAPHAASHQLVPPIRLHTNQFTQRPLPRPPGGAVPMVPSAASHLQARGPLTSMAAPPLLQPASRYPPSSPRQVPGPSGPRVPYAHAQPPMVQYSISEVVRPIGMAPLGPPSYPVRLSAYMASPASHTPDGPVPGTPPPYYYTPSHSVPATPPPSHYYLPSQRDPMRDIYR